MKRLGYTVVALLCCIACAVGIGLNRFSIQAEEKAVKQTVSVEAFGAFPSDGEDDTQAFLDALASGKVIHLGKGTYELKETLCLTDQTIIGAGTSSTIINFKNSDKTKPILKLGGRCTVTDLALQFDESQATYTEGQGEHVAIWLGNGKPADGSQLKNLRFTQVGTALYSPNQENSGASRLLVDTLFISDCGYRGVDFRKSGQYGNAFSNIYIGGRANLKHPRSAGFAVEGKEYNLTVEQLNLEHYYFDSALLLKNCYGARFGSIHMEAIGQSAPNTGHIKLDNSDVTLEAVTLYYNPQDYMNCGVIELANAGQNGNRVNIGTLHLKGLNNVHPSNHDARDGGLLNPNAAGFKTVCRTVGATGTYTMDIGVYTWFTWEGDAHIYQAFPCDTAGIEYLSKGLL